MEVDRRAFLASLGTGTLGLMDAEDKAEALEHYMLDQLEARKGPAESAEGDESQQDAQPRGTGNLLLPRSTPLEPMPERPTFLDFFRLRLSGTTTASRAPHMRWRRVSRNAR